MTKTLSIFLVALGLAVMNSYALASAFGCHGVILAGFVSFVIAKGVIQVFE